ncbi:MAG TPA: DUF5658 family protein [Acidimicrobiales bacterium]|nr:DUF5658 family protein [Acidimicrobiales bacterium]
MTPNLSPIGAPPAERPGVGRRYLSGPVADKVRIATLVAIGALAVLNGADVVTTRLLLRHEGGIEANPLSALLLASQSLLWVKLGILAILGLKVLHSRPRLGVMAVACFAAGIYATAVISNLLVLHLAVSA